VKAPASLAAAIQSLGKKATAPRVVKRFAWGTFWIIDVPGSEAIHSWQHLRDHAGKTGFWPVIVSSPAGPGVGTAEGLVEQWIDDDEGLEESPDVEGTPPVETSQTPAEIISAAQAFPFEKWVQQEHDPEFQITKHLREADVWAARDFGEAVARSHRELAEMWRTQPKRSLDPAEYRIPPANNRNPPQQELSCIIWYDSGTPGSRVADSVEILLVPTEFSWQVPAYLSFTTMEGKRRPELHTAALKWLLDRFGAELVGIDTRILEVIPRERPRGKKEALQAADALGTYSCCAVTSENEMASLEELAFYLMESKYWSFCWP
jgi:hypothetical protein